jgi:hypothetical protein
MALDKPRAPRFDIGDRVILTYIRGARKVLVAVVISKVGVWICEDSKTNEETGKEVLAYVVSSGRGGELRVPPSALRPDTILDRMIIAFDGQPLP